MSQKHTKTKIKKLPDLIFLCGFMGAGKTATGKQLAEELGTEFIDLDELIEAEAASSIPDIFAKEGEEAFRKKERSAVMDVIRNKQGVVALGGGALQDQHLLDHVKLNGLLIFIATPFSVIFDRISADKGRPMLLDEDGKLKSPELLEEELHSLYEERLPLYRQAVIRIDSSAFEGPDQLVDELIRKIRNHVAYHKG